MTTYHCQNCDWKGPEYELAPYADMEERLEIGDTVPAGECPECGAVCWSDEELAKQALEGAAPKMLEALKAITAEVARLRLKFAGLTEDSPVMIAAREAIYAATGVRT